MYRDFSLGRREIWEEGATEVRRDMVIFSWLALAEYFFSDDADCYSTMLGLIFHKGYEE